MDRVLAMQVFVAVVDCGSQTAAAAQLGLSRPVVSRSLGELEGWVGARLLHRTTRRLNLTSTGAEVLPMCRRLIELTTDIQAAAAHPLDEPQGHLRVTTSTSFGQAQLTAAVTDFIAIYPRIKVDLLLLDRTVNLVEEGIDLAIRISNDLDPHLISRRLTDCESIVCATPTYLERHGMPSSVEDLERHNCLTHTYHGHGLWRFERSGEPVGVTVDGGLCSNDAVALQQAVLRDAGIALLPSFLAAPMIQQGRLTELLPDYKPETLGIHAVYASRKHMAIALRTLVDFLAERFSRKDAWHLLVKK